MYGSSLMIETVMPRLLSNRPTLAAVMPLPSEEVTPPVTKTYFAMVRYLSYRLGVATVTARKQGGQSLSAREVSLPQYHDRGLSSQRRHQGSASASSHLWRLLRAAHGEGRRRSSLP